MKFWKPCNPYVNLLVVGDSKSGKSSLVKALIDESKYFGGIRNTGTLCSFKSGIVLHEFTRKHYGNVTFCELAGPREYYDSLPVELKCGVLILVINVADNDFKKKLSYWISFLRCKVIVVCSHSDLLLSNYLETCKADIFNSHSLISSVFTIDCCKSASPGICELVEALSSICNQQRKDIHLKNISFIILQFLQKHFQNVPVVKVSTAVEKLLSDKFMSRLLKSESKEAYIYELVTELNSSGLILFFKNSSHEMDGWIVLDKTAVVSLVHTAVNKCTMTSTNFAGLVSHNKIRMAAISVNLNETFLLEYLLSMKYCYEVKDDLVLSSVALIERVFFFPNFIDTEPPATVWPEKNFNYVCLGWTYRCSSVDHFFLPKFIQVLLLRLVYHFKPLISMNTRTYLQKHMCVWRNGVYCTDGAVECLVEVPADSSAVHLMMRTESLQQLTNMYKLQSSVISKILSIHQEYGPQVEMDEFLVLPSVVKSYPPDNYWNEDALISISDIADAVITSKSHITITADAQSRVKLASILPIEPLVGLSSDIVKLMLSESKDNLCSKEFLYQLASEVYDKSELAPLPPIVNKPVESIEMCYTHIDKWRRESNGTFGALLKEISSHSVFCGRNPLNLASPSTLAQLSVDDSCSRPNVQKERDSIVDPMASTVVCDSLLEAFEFYEQDLFQALEDPSQYTDGLLHCGLVTLPVAEAIRLCTDEMLCKKIILFSIKFQIQKDESKFNHLCSVLKEFPATDAIANSLIHIESQVHRSVEKPEVIANGTTQPEQSFIASSEFEELMDQADIGNTILTAVHCFSHHLISEEMLALVFLSSEPKEVLMDKLTYLFLTEMQEALTVLKSHRDTANLAKKLEGINLLPELEVIAEESFVVKGPDKLTFDRRRAYGFLLEVPAGAVRLKEGCVVKVKACLPKTTPVGLRLLSAVYEITTPGSDQHPLGPVNVEIEHCAHIQQEDELKQLCFLTSAMGSSDSQSPLQLQKTKNVVGKFSLKSCYGSIKLTKFSFFGIFDDSSTEVIYSAKVYLQNESFIKKAIYFILLKYHTVHERAIEKHYSPYSREEASVQDVVFSDGSSQVKLNIEREQDYEGWKIWTNTHPLIISKRAVESFKPGKSPPECKVLAKASDGAENCLYHINLEGTEQPKSVTVNLSCNDGPSPMVPQTGYSIWSKIVIALFIAMGFIAVALLMYFLSSVGHCTSIENWRDADNFLKYGIVDEWRDLGSELGLESSILTAIELNHKQNVERMRQEMIGKWLDSSPQPCWEELIQALQRIDQNRLARLIEQEMFSWNVSNAQFLLPVNLIALIGILVYLCMQNR